MHHSAPERRLKERMTYTGPRDVLTVDLSTQTWYRSALEDATFAQTLGGVGLAVYLIDRAIDAKIDPLGPDNAIVFAAGPFAGTPIPSATKHAIATISPLTGLLNEGLSSSHWSAALRHCGLAALVVRGAAATWTTLVIEDEDVRFEDAHALLGQSAREVTKSVRAQFGDRRWRTCAIGVAGEKLVRFAALENDGRQAGRGGTGAVMGAKRLKAIVLRGTSDIPLANAERANELALALRARTLGPETAKYRILGTGANMRALQRMGQLPTRNFTSAVFEGAERVTPERAREAPQGYVELRAGCANCPLQCEHMYVRKDRDRKSAAASEYESTWALGPNCGVDDLDAVLDAIAACDRYGLDTISTGGVIAFAMECAQRGLLDENTFGVPLRFGNGAVLLPAIEAIAHARGLGATLGLGVRAAAHAIGGAAPGFAMHAKGLELPGYEPRALPTYALSLAVCTRGACHNRAATYDADLRGTTGNLDEVARAELAIAGENVAIIWDSLVLCKFIRGCFEDFYAEGAALFEAVSGLAVGADGLAAAAALAWARKREINRKQEWTPEQDVLPPRLFTPLSDGPLAGAQLEPRDVGHMVRIYEAKRTAEQQAIWRGAQILSQL